MRLQPQANQAHTLSIEELRTLVLEDGNYLPQKHQSILLNLFDLEAITVDDVMVPRNQIEAVDIECAARRDPRQIVDRLSPPAAGLPGAAWTTSSASLHVRHVLNLSQGEDIRRGDV